MALALERLIRLGETLARPRERRAHRTPLDLQHVRDLPVVESFFLEQQRLPVALAELLERLARHRGALRALEREVRPRLVIVARLGGEELEVPPVARIAPCPVTHEVVRHREDPAALVHDRLLPQGPDERLLRDLLGPVAVTQPSGEIPHERGVVLAEETFGLVHEVDVTSRVRSPRGRRHRAVRSPTGRA
jgi:hypothetical protein